jgi:hypothetical protein
LGQAGDERRQVGIGRVLLEGDGVAAVHVLEVAFVALHLNGLRGGVFDALGIGFSLRAAGWVAELVP